MGRQSGEEVGGQGDEPSPAGDGVHETGDERQRAHDEKLHDAFPSRLSATLAGRKKSRPRAAREFLVAPTGFEPATSALRGRRPKPLDDGATWALHEAGRRGASRPGFLGSSDRIRTGDLRLERAAS